MNDWLRISAPEAGSREHKRTFGLKGVPDWHSHNQRVLKGDIIHVTDKNTAITKNCIEQINAIAKTDYTESTDQIKHRAQHINYWKSELEQAIRDIADEISALEVMRQRLKSAMSRIKTSESIAKECYKLRSNRMGLDLILDGPEETIVFEISLIEEISKVYNNLLADIEDQMVTNVNAKERLESDWSYKEIGYKNENDSLQLKFNSRTVKMVPGVTRLSERQSNVETWESFSENSLAQFKNAHLKSMDLREKVDATLINAARDLRTQDGKINEALVNRIGRTEDVKKELENQLDLTLKNIVEVENIMEVLNEEIRKLCQRLRVTHTRLNNKSIRPDLENCREGSLLGLIEEVKNLNDGISLMRGRLRESQDNHNKLIEERSQLENEIIIKRKSLHIDRDRCLVVRSHYLSASSLCGH